MSIRKLFLAGLFSVCFLSLNAHNPSNGKIRCGTAENTKRLIEKNPELSEIIAKDQQFLETLIQQDQSVHRSSGNVVHTIPVVVHVVYRTASQNISDAQILSQIDALNEDFGKTNADTGLVPAPWKSLAANTNFQFCLAQVDPNGNATNGIERRQTTMTSFNDDKVKSFSTGGLNAWDVSRYFNIWVCNLGGGLLGYAEIPTSTPSNTYGVVIGYDSFGRTANLSPPYNKGRTTTHEVGHCFSLYHIWGDDNGSCSGDDGITDTPRQASENYDCQVWPKYDACTGPTGNGYMFMNYMDYTDDACMYMFTNGQANRMALAMSSFYPSLLTSNACTFPNAITEGPDNFSFSIYPNPSDGILNLDMNLTRNLGSELTITVHSVIGKTIHQEKIYNPSGSIHQLDLSANPSGIYFITLQNESFKKTLRFELAK
ncbi:MAG: T9SS C-terminal target domain-containing protein [Bacteroidetes bacterium]|nr:MAG: T9SS C-terminal target domain-containing protein [Bacteroidota bacterium]REK06644.1 MAG: T9SS C-terminal target domain-containing protein [Bacteroidota bacterium]REK33410.1 MAG: T9SS C-terminal target domain-containing protein [Bacteroidota bacterium]REK49808.1 MAG: T9SS C-terminal target domain-containing protein [Bacteroidota bacterium]